MNRCFLTLLIFHSLVVGTTHAQSIASNHDDDQTRASSLVGDVTQPEPENSQAEGSHRTQTWHSKNQEALTVQGAVLKTIDSTAVPARSEGTIRVLQVREGDRVEANQLLGKLNDQAMQLLLTKAATQLQIAREKQKSDINLRLAEKAQQVADNELQRAISANRLVPDTYPRNELDRLRLVSDKARLEVERANHERRIASLETESARNELQQIQQRLELHEIRAPVSGVVVAVEKHLGEWVEAGTEVVRIVRLDRLRVEGFLPVMNATFELVGRTAEVTAKSDEQSLHASGKVVFVSPDVNTINSLVRIYIEVPNMEDELRPGLPVEATIHPPAQTSQGTEAP